MQLCLCPLRAPNEDTNKDGSDPKGCRLLPSVLGSSPSLPCCSPSTPWEVRRLELDPDVNEAIGFTNKDARRLLSVAGRCTQLRDGTAKPLEKLMKRFRATGREIAAV